MANFKVVFVLFVASVIVSGISALKCYYCDGCSEPFDSKGTGVSVIDCTGSCIIYKKQGNVLRSCNTDGSADMCTTENDLEACSCTSDLCNNSMRVSTSSVTSIIILTTVVTLLFT